MRDVALHLTITRACPGFAQWCLRASLLVGSALALTAGAAENHHHGDHTMHAAPAGALAGIVGMEVEAFELTDQGGVTHAVFDKTDTEAVVLMTQGNGCPIVRNAMPVFAEVRDAYSDRGVDFYLLNPNLQDDADSIATEVSEFGWDITVLVDDTQSVGEALRVTRTAEIFVIDTDTRRVVYHGPVDDRLTYQRQRAQPRYTYLADALDAVLAGEAVPVAQVDAPGCIINFPNRQLKSQG